MRLFPNFIYDRLIDLEDYLQWRHWGKSRMRGVNGLVKRDYDNSPWTLRLVSNIVWADSLYFLTYRPFRPFLTRRRWTEAGKAEKSKRDNWEEYVEHRCAVAGIDTPKTRSCKHNLYNCGKCFPKSETAAADPKSSPLLSFEPGFSEYCADCRFNQRNATLEGFYSWREALAPPALSIPKNPDVAEEAVITDTDRRSRINALIDSLNSESD